MFVSKKMYWWLISLVIALWAVIDKSRIRFQPLSAYVGQQLQSPFILFCIGSLSVRHLKMT